MTRWHLCRRTHCPRRPDSGQGGCQPGGEVSVHAAELRLGSGAGDENRIRTISLGSWTTCLQVVFSCCWNAADLVPTPPQMYRRRPLLTVANGTLMARRSWPSMGRCRQLAARRRPPGQGSPAPAGGGAPHSELFGHATRSAAARARLVRQDEHPRKAQRVRHAPGASRRRRLRWSPLRQHHVSVRSFGCTGGFRRSNERRRGSNQCSRRKTSQSRPESRFHDVAPVTRQCSERTLAGKISKKLSLRSLSEGPARRGQPSAGEGQAGRRPAGSVAPA